MPRIDFAGYKPVLESARRCLKLTLTSAMKALKAAPALWLDIPHAMAELALANRRLRKSEARDLLTSSAKEGRRGAELSDHQRGLVMRVAYVVPRVARRMPWRSDCLVQALAARRWLTGQNIPSTLHIGTRKTPGKGFEAHAWLGVADIIVTGWDIADFTQFAVFPPP